MANPRPEPLVPSMGARWPVGPDGASRPVSGHWPVSVTRLPHLRIVAAQGRSTHRANGQLLSIRQRAHSTGFFAPADRPHQERPGPSRRTSHDQPPPPPPSPPHGRRTDPAPSAPHPGGVHLHSPQRPCLLYTSDA